METRHFKYILILLLLPVAVSGQIQKAYVKYFTTAAFRNTEGDLLVKTNGQYYCVWSQFRNGTADNTTADIAAKYSADSGRNWVDLGIIQENFATQTVMSVSLVRINSTVVHLYFCAKNSSADLRIYRKISADDCVTWGAAQEVINDNGYMPALNAVVIKTSSGRLLIPVYYTTNVDVIPPYLYAFCWYSDNNGVNWTKSTPNITHSASVGYVEPAVLELSPGNIMMNLRNETGVQDFSTSTNDGTTWTAGTGSTLSSTHSPAKIIKLSTGALIALHNPVVTGFPHPRSVLRVSKSVDGGTTWVQLFDLESNKNSFNFSYPSITEYDGRLICTYWELNPTAGKYALKFAAIPLLIL